MRRPGLWLLSAILLTASVTLPILAAIQLSWVMATHAQLDRLQTFDRRVIQRAQASFKGATDALKALTTLELPPCSAAHIAKMREVVANNRFITEVGYFGDDDFIQCTSWGLTTIRLKRPPPEFQTDSGIDVINNLIPRIVSTEPRTALFLGRYDVLVDPKMLADVVVTPDIKLAIASVRAGVLATQNDPDPALVASLLVNPRKGSDERYLFAAERAGNLIGVAIQPRESAVNTVERVRSLLIPLAALVSFALAAAVVWVIRRKNSPGARLAAAVRRRVFTVHYQPLIELATGACVGAEALVRWQRRDGTFVSPERFIPLAEETGLIRDITEQVIDNVLRDMRELLCDDRSLHIGINLSASDIAAGQIVARIQEKLGGTGIGPDQIWLELTERSFVDIERARAVIVEAHKFGHSIAIDDFGTGYSSLQHLQSLPLDTLKIDKSFIDTIGRSTATSSVTPHIIDMAKTLNLLCVAEGIETQEQLAYLKAQGVQLGQGWLFSKALSARDFFAFCKASRERSGATAPLRGQERRWRRISTQPIGE